MKKIVIGCDHAGFQLKGQVIASLKEAGYDVTDVGTYSEENCSYPAIAHELCTKIQNGERELGILICGTGIGMSLCANKHKGIRAACCSDVFSARLTRNHNDANVLCFGARVVGYGVAMDLVNAFLEAEFEGGIHSARVDLITATEEGNFDALK